MVEISQIFLRCPPVSLNHPHFFHFFFFSRWAERQRQGSRWYKAVKNYSNKEQMVSRDHVGMTDPEVKKKKVLSSSGPVSAFEN